jgi:hypothetical protein
MSGVIHRIRPYCGMVFVLAACSREPVRSTTARFSESPREDAALGGTVPDASPAVVVDPITDVVTRWNEAHNHHDADALAALYAPTVSFYEADISNSDAVKRKRGALAAAPDYTQSLSEIEPSQVDENGGVFVRFKKTTASKGSSKAFPGYLYVMGGHIVAEGDRDPEGWGTRYTYCYGPGDSGPKANDTRVGVFKVSAVESLLAVRYSKLFADLQASSRGRIGLEIRDCAHGCAPGDFGTCKGDDIVDYFVVANVDERTIAGFGINPITKAIKRVKVSSER